jgi:hypothetical protein
VLFYFAGHGLQRVVDEGILLLDDFLAPDDSKLGKCALVGNLRAGMTPSVTYPNIAKNQVFFIDACLLENEALGKFVNPLVPEVFNFEANGPLDQRASAVLFSAVNRAAAIGRDGQSSYFAEALLAAFENGAEEATDLDGRDVWPVTANTIKTAVSNYFAKMQLGTVSMANYVGEPVIRYLSAAPDVDVDVWLRPDQLECEVAVLDGDTDHPLPHLQPFPTPRFGVKLKAGSYKVQVTSTKLRSNPFKSPIKPINQRTSFWRPNLTSSLA